MQRPTLLRTITADDLMVRSDAVGRTILARVMRYNAPARVSDDGRRFYREQFEAGAFTRTLAERGHKVRLLTSHDRTKLPVGVASEWNDGPTELVGAFTVARTVAGDEALELARLGAVGVSVGFAPIRDIKRGDVVSRAEVALREVSLVSVPAYDDAEVLGVRGDAVPEQLSREVAEARLALLRWRRS